MRDLEWTKSSHSTNGNCVEVAWLWRKSSHSAHNGECVQVAPHDGKVLVRDSKDPDGPVLKFTPAEWEAFRLGVLGGEFDLPEGLAAPLDGSDV